MSDFSSRLRYLTWRDAVATTTVASVVMVMAMMMLFGMGFYAEQFAKRSFIGWMTFLVVLMLVAASVLIACPHVYAVVHAGIVREWR